MNKQTAHNHPHCIRNILQAIIPLIIILCGMGESLAASGLSDVPTNVLFERGRTYAAQPEMADSALACYIEIINRYEDDPSPEARQYLARAYKNSAYIWEYTNYDYRQAITELSRLLYQCESLPTKIPTEAVVCLNLGNIFNNYATHQDEPEKYLQQASEYWQHSLTVAHELHQWETMLRAFLHLSGKAIEAADTKEGRANMRSLCKFLNSSGAPNGIPLREYCRARASAMQAMADGELSLSAELLKKELNCIDTDVTPERYRINTYNSLISTYALLNEADSVEHYLNLVELTISEHNIKGVGPMLTQSRLKYSRFLSRPQSPDSLRSSLKEEAIDILYDYKLDNISDLYLEYRIEKSNLKEEEYIRNRSKGITIICIITSLMAATAAFVIFLTLKLRRLKRRNRRLYDLAHAAANRSTSTPGPTRQDDAPLRLQSAENTVSAPEATSPEAPADSINQKYAGSTLSAETLRKIFNKAIGELDATDGIYSPEFSLTRLAELVGTKPRYLSQAINEIDGRNFNAILNERRIHEACRRFDDIAGYGNMTVEAVGQSVGFRSRSAFTEAFKKVAGMTPSAYARIARSKR